MFSGCHHLHCRKDETNDGARERQRTRQETCSATLDAELKSALGDLCGAVFLDSGFSHLLQSLIRSSTWDKLGMRAITKLMNDDWEHGIKPSFTGDRASWDIAIPYGGNEDIKYHAPYIKISR